MITRILQAEKVRLARKKADGSVDHLVLKVPPPTVQREN